MHTLSCLMQVAFSCLGKVDGSAATVEEVAQIIQQWQKHNQETKSQPRDASSKATAAGKWPGLRQAGILGGKSPDACRAAIIKVLR